MRRASIQNFPEPSPSITVRLATSVFSRSEAVIVRRLSAFSFNYPTDQLIKGIDNTLFAVGNDDLRPQMINLDFSFFCKYVFDDGCRFYRKYE